MQRGAAHRCLLQRPRLPAPVLLALIPVLLPCAATRISFWGDALVWGNRHKKDSAQECAAACVAHKPPADDPDGMDCNSERGGCALMWLEAGLGGCWPHGWQGAQVGSYELEKMQLALHAAMRVGG